MKATNLWTCDVTGTNPCARSNGGCLQLCFHLGSGRRTCSCAHGRLAEDGFACERYEGYLLYSERTTLKSIHLSDENDLNSPVQPLENPVFFKNAVALAFDYSQRTARTNRIFFSDVHFGNIQMINDDWTGRSVIAESKCQNQMILMFCKVFCPSIFLPSPSWSPVSSTLMSMTGVRWRAKASVLLGQHPLPFSPASTGSRAQHLLNPHLPSHTQKLAECFWSPPTPFPKPISCSSWCGCCH